MKPKVFVTHGLPGNALERLKNEAEVEVYEENETITKEMLIEKLQGITGVISLLVNEIDEEVMSQAPQLKIISNYAVGYNNINVEAATERNILVTNTPDVLTEATADLTWALLLAIARRIPESDQYTRQGHFKGWEPELLLGRSVNDKVLGIIGMGRIGEAVARRAKGFNMKILYHKRKRLPEEKERELNAEYVSLKELLKKSDFVSLHVPLTRESHHLISAEQFKLMKPESFLINTSRGPLVDESALVDALRTKEIAGAALDVFEEEPAIEPGLIELKNVILAPHIGSATVETRVEMANLAVDNVLAVLKGDPPLTPVNDITTQNKR